MPGGVIVEDSRQQPSKHDRKHEWWGAHGVAFEERSRALPFGDYMVEGSNVSIDTKRSLLELSSNLGKQHERFAAELRRAFDAGYRLVILVETDEVSGADELRRWVNPVCRGCDIFRIRGCDPLQSGKCDLYGKRQRPVQGPRMAKMVGTLEERTGARFEFVEPSRSAMRICELLGVEWE